MKNVKIIKDNSINIVMYHYVRPIKNSDYPTVKGLEFDDFKKQIDFFCNNFNVINDKDLIEIIKSKKIPKKPSILLTFDDGYLDHYEYVFPYLIKKKITGLFYPPKKVLENKSVLDVNKIHFILIKEQNRKKILKKINDILFKKKKIKIDNLNIKNINLNSPYDDKDTVLIKKLLQYFIPNEDKEFILSKLFEEFVNEDIEIFAKKIYLNSNHVKEMYSNKMKFGSHGDNHKWLEFLDKNEQEKEMKESLNFFKELGIDDQDISICYPYGSYNKETLALAEKLNFSFGVTTKVGNVDINNIGNKYQLNRFDTNEFKNLD